MGMISHVLHVSYLMPLSRRIFFATRCRIYVATLSLATRGGSMDQQELVAHIRSGEGISTEFKRCGSHPEEDFFQTVCSFANRQGGNVFLGWRTTVR